MRKKRSEQYDEEPVFYCTKCLSLKILSIEGLDMCYCGKCGTVEVDTTDIHTFKKLEREKLEKSKSFIK